VQNTKAAQATYAWRNDYQLLGAGLAVVLLLVAVMIDDQSRGYYTFLRIFVTIVAGAVAWQSQKAGHNITVLVAGTIAILFNPFIQVELEQDSWQLIDLFVAGWFSWVAMERPAALRDRPLLRFAPVAGIISLFVVVLGGVYLIDQSRNRVPSPYSYNETANTDVAEPALPAPVPPARSPEVLLADAFFAATGRRAEYNETVDGDVVTTKPLRIVQLPFGSALLTERTIKDGCHACTGAIGVYYLEEGAETTTVKGSWPEAIKGWGWGAPPQNWQLTTKFSSNPVIYAEGGYMGQGITMESAMLTELTPDGPVTSDLIGTGFSDEGAIVDESRSACLIKGRITNVRKDRGFDVVISGSVKGLDRYRKRGGKFVQDGKRLDWGVPCDQDEQATTEAPPTD
jgi:hypothetical protein